MHHVESEKYNPSLWYENLIRISHLPPYKKYRALSQLHDETLSEYIKDLESMTDVEAELEGSDGRKRKIVVAHIAGWEESQIQVFEDKNPPARLQEQLNFRAYVDSDTGKSLDFSHLNDRQKSVDDFNAYQAAKYQNCSWKDIREKAIGSAQRLRKCFPSEPSEEFLEFLENSPLKTWKLKKGLQITVPAGFYLWMVSLKHEAIEHRSDIASIK